MAKNLLVGYHWLWGYLRRQPWPRTHKVFLHFFYILFGRQKNIQEGTWCTHVRCTCKQFLLNYVLQAKNTQDIPLAFLC